MAETKEEKVLKQHMCPHPSAYVPWQSQLCPPNWQFSVQLYSVFSESCGKISPIVPKEQCTADNKCSETREADSADLRNGTFLLLKWF